MSISFHPHFSSPHKDRPSPPKKAATELRRRPPFHTWHQHSIPNLLRNNQIKIKKTTGFRIGDNHVLKGCDPAYRAIITPDNLDEYVSLQGVDVVYKLSPDDVKDANYYVKSSCIIKPFMGSHPCAFVGTSLGAHNLVFIGTARGCIRVSCADVNLQRGHR